MDYLDLLLPGRGPRLPLPQRPGSSKDGENERAPTSQWTTNTPPTAEPRSHFNNLTEHRTPDYLDHANLNLDDLYLNQPRYLDLTEHHYKGYLDYLDLLTNSWGKSQQKQPVNLLDYLNLVYCHYKRHRHSTKSSKGNTLNHADPKRHTETLQEEPEREPPHQGQPGVPGAQPTPTLPEDTPADEADTVPSWHQPEEDLSTVSRTSHRRRRLLAALSDD